MCIKLLSLVICRHPDRQRALSQAADHQDLHQRRRPTGDRVQNPRQVPRSASPFSLMPDGKQPISQFLCISDVVPPNFAFPAGQFVLEHHTLPGHKSHLMPPDHLGGIEFDIQLLWSAQTFDSPYQLWRATSSYSRSEAVIAPQPLSIYLCTLTQL